MNLGTRFATVPAIAAAALLAAACGSESPPPTSSVNSVTTAVPGIDQCLVGTWRSTGVSGSASYADAGGASSVQWSGGDGDVMTIRSDSSFAIDYNRETPWQGVGNDGATYQVTTTGAIGGRVATAGGELAEAIDNAAAAHISVTRNGKPFRDGSPTSPQTFSYHCSAGTTLTITQGQTTESWAPAGS